MRWLRNLVVRAPYAQPVDLQGRRMIVTGAAPGSIGFATARTLASWGADVTVTTRSDPASLAQALRASLSAGSGSIDVDVLDLADAKSVSRFAGAYAERHGRLDVLVNNAGIHLDLLSQWREPRLVDGIEIHWRTNYLGTMQLTHALLPLLLQGAVQTKDARVVNVVSMLHARGRNAFLFAPITPYNSWVAYGTSKLALVHASFELQRRHAAAGLQAYCLHPGAVFSNIAAKGLAGNPRLAAIRDLFAPVERFFLLTPDEGAQTQIRCATAAQLAGGQYFRNCAPAFASGDALDAQAASRLWDETQAWIAEASPP
ncbi:MAG TPA: SDR family NAD(P)-dependent oxidoreductase [Solimonas sp.]|nr:SDR family NAD(P)-dependent oxidoreductase [Solimonas sp.]